MRLIGQQKMGFYPTPPVVTDLIGSWLQFPDGPFPALDPCAGEGEALACCLQGPAGVGYGIEIDGGRVLEARQRLPHVLCGDALLAHTAAGAWSLLWLNPPYDDGTASGGGRAERLEQAFLAKYLPRLVPGGVLVYIIPHKQLSPEIATLLAYQCEGLRYWRFPNTEYRRFWQVVILGRRKGKPYDDEGTAAALLRFGRQHLRAAPLPRRSPEDRPFAVPAAPPEVERFASGQLSAAALAAACTGSPCWSRMAAMIGTTGMRTAGRPPVTPHKGHLALQLAAGEVDGPVGIGELRHVVRGSAIKYQRRETRSETVINSRGEREVHEREFDVDHFRVSVMALAPDGTLYTL